MRTAFIDKLTELAGRDDRPYLITSDSGFEVLDDYRDRFPKQYLNIGISESAMIGLASGLALSGKSVFVYGIVPFVTMRCFEQIRNDLCLENLPVRIAGVGPGLTYGAEGATHHAIEDIAIMSSLPNMTVICPGDPVETGHAVGASMTLEGPAYIRIGKSSEAVHRGKNLDSFQLGKGIILREGRDVAIISTGDMLSTAVCVDETLRRNGISPTTVSMHTVKPIDRDLVVELSRTCRIIATIEEHSLIGGLGSILANVISEEHLDVELVKFSLPDQYVDITGNQNYLRNHFHLSAEHISETLLGTIDG